MSFQLSSLPSDLLNRISSYVSYSDARSTRTVCSSIYQNLSLSIWAGQASEAQSISTLAGFAQSSKFILYTQVHNDSKKDKFYELEVQIPILIQNITNVGSLILKLDPTKIKDYPWDNYLIALTQGSENTLNNRKKMLKSYIFCQIYLKFIENRLTDNFCDSLLSNLDIDQVNLVLEFARLNSFSQITKTLVLSYPKFFSRKNSDFELFNNVISEIVKNDDDVLFAHLYNKNKDKNFFLEFSLLSEYKPKKIMNFICDNVTLSGDCKKFVLVIHSLHNMKNEDKKFKDLYVKSIKDFTPYPQTNGYGKYGCARLLLATCSQEGSSIFRSVFGLDDFEADCLNNEEIKNIFIELIEDNCIDNFKLAWSKFNLNLLSYAQLLYLGILSDNKQQTEITELIYNFVKLKFSSLSSLEPQEQLDFMDLCERCRDKDFFLKMVRESTNYDYYAQNHYVAIHKKNINKSSLKELNPFVNFAPSSDSPEILIDKSTGNPWYYNKTITRVQLFKNFLFDLIVTPIVIIYLSWLAGKVSYLATCAFASFINKKQDTSITLHIKNIREFKVPLSAIVMPFASFLTVFFPLQGSKIMVYLETISEVPLMKPYKYPLTPLPKFLAPKTLG